MYVNKRNRYKEVIYSCKLNTVDDFQYALKMLKSMTPTKNDAAKIYWMAEIHNLIGFINYPIAKTLNNEKKAIDKIYRLLVTQFQEALHYLFMLFKEYLYQSYKTKFSEEIGDIIFDSVYDVYDDVNDIYRQYNNCAKMVVKILKVNIRSV